MESTIWSELKSQEYVRSAIVLDEANTFELAIHCEILTVKDISGEIPAVTVID